VSVATDTPESFLDSLMRYGYVSLAE